MRQLNLRARRLTGHEKSRDWSAEEESQEYKLSKIEEFILSDRLTSKPVQYELLTVI